MPPKGKVQGNEAAMLTKNKQAEVNMTMQEKVNLQENINTNVMKESESAGEIVLGKNQITADQLLKEPTYAQLMKSKFNKKSKKYQESKTLVNTTKKESFEKMSPQDLMKWATASSVVDGATELFQNVVTKLEEFNGASDRIQTAIEAKDIATAKKELAILQQNAKDLTANAGTYMQNRKGFFGIKFSEKGRSRLAFCNALKYMAVETIAMKQIFLNNLEEPRAYILDDNAAFQDACIQKIKSNEADFGIQLNEKNGEQISKQRGKAFGNMIKTNAEFRFKRDSAFLKKADEDESLKNDPNYEYANKYRENGIFNVNSYIVPEMADLKCLFAKHINRGGAKSNPEVVNKLKTAFDSRVNELTDVFFEKKILGFETDALKDGELKNKIGHEEELVENKESALYGIVESFMAAAECLDQGTLFPEEIRGCLTEIGLGDDSLYEK